MVNKVQPIPKGFHSITPYLIVNEAQKAIQFYKEAFDAEEIMRMDKPNGKIGHAELKIGDSIIMLADEFPEMNAFSPKQYGGTGVFMHLYVEDVDKTFENAIKAGAKKIRPVEDQFWGDRLGTIEDPFGHLWSISTHKEDLTPEEIHRRFEGFKKKV